MSWADFFAARLLVAERRFGAPLRAQQRAEIAAIERTKAMIRRHEGGPTNGTPMSATPAVIRPRPITDEVVG